MNIVQNLRRQAGITQRELAEMGGTSQSTIAAYETGAKSPTIRTVENLARSQNLEMSVTYLPQMTREDKRSLAFHRAIVEVLRKDPVTILSRAKRNLEKLSKMHPGAHMLFDQWKDWLILPLENLASKILDPLPEAREMRQVSPFSGVLSPKQRAQILRQFRREYEL
jgi:transcriptional regulator with XRE-family HTH domain